MGKVKSLFEDEQEREYQRRFDEIAYERGLHPDDDAEEIEQILFDENEAAYERYQESLMENGHLPGSAF